MEIRQNARLVSTRPIVFVFALLFALALGLIGWYALPTSPSSHPQVVNTPKVGTSGSMGPDAVERNE